MHTNGALCIVGHRPGSLAALQVGLVDEVGGLARATEVAKQLAGLPLEPEATITAEWPPR